MLAHAFPVVDTADGAEHARHVLCHSDLAPVPKSDIRVLSVLGQQGYPPGSLRVNALAHNGLERHMPESRVYVCLPHFQSVTSPLLVFPDATQEHIQAFILQFLPHCRAGVDARPAISLQRDSTIGRKRQRSVRTETCRQWA